MCIDTGYDVVTTKVKQTDDECPKPAPFWQKWYNACHAAEIPCSCKLPYSQQRLQFMVVILWQYPVPLPTPVFRWHLKPSMCKGLCQSKCAKSEAYIHMFTLCHTLLEFINNTNPAFKILFSEQNRSHSNHSNGITVVWPSVYWSQRVLNYDLFYNLNCALIQKWGNKVLHMQVKQAAWFICQKIKPFEPVHSQSCNASSE